MEETRILVQFDESFHGVAEGERARLLLGLEEGAFRPYELLFGALASCLYHTYLDILRKKRLHHRRVTLEVKGRKREEVPTTLELVRILVKIEGCEHPKGARQALDLATKYCSIYQTLAHVAKMEYDVIFIDE